MHAAAIDAPFDLSHTKIPSLPGKFPLGVLPDLQANPLRVMERATFGYGPVVRLPVPKLQVFALGHPSLAEHVLVTNVRNYGKQTRGYQMLRLVLGQGLVTSEGDFWKRQRQIAQPAFHRERMAGFGAIMVRAANQMVDGWRMGAELDLSSEMMRCTLKVVCESLLGGDVQSEAERLGAALTEVLEHLAFRISHLASPPQWIPTPRNRAFARALRGLDAVVHEVIARRRSSTTPSEDLLGMLMSARDPDTKEGMDDRQLRDEVMTILLAGHETTATALGWAFSLLGRAPPVERSVVAELSSVLGDRSPSFEDVPKLRAVSCVVKETLRLYPPIWMYGRRVEADEVVFGARLPKGALVFLSPWVLHRDPKYWPNPEAFDPDRWLQEDPTRPRGAYLPFSLGQRKCIGDGFAIVEATIILATVLRRVHLTLVPGQAFEPEPLMTLRTRGGVRAVASRR